MKITKGNGENMKKVVCNQCGRSFEYCNEVLKSDLLCIRKDWGYFSKKDGQHHEILICEDCYDRWIAGFCYPPSITGTKELL